MKLLMAVCYLNVMYSKEKQWCDDREENIFLITVLMHDCEEEKQFIIDFYHSAFVDDE